MIRLTLKQGREVSVLRKHPWVFSGAVGRLEGDGGDGVAEVADARGRVLAHGAYSPASQIVARLWTFDGRRPDEALFRERFEAARRLRDEVVPAETTGYRAVNSEGDLCPGVVADVYGGTAVLDLTTGGTEAWATDLEAAFREVFSPERMVLRLSGERRDAGAEGHKSAPHRNPLSGSSSEARGAKEEGEGRTVSPSMNTGSISSRTFPADRRPGSFSTSGRIAAACASSPGDERFSTSSPTRALFRSRPWREGPRQSVDVDSSEARCRWPASTGA